MVYFVGVLKGGGVKGLHDTGSYPEGTIVVQARRYVDHLSCEIADYLGPRETTKKRLKETRLEILKVVQKLHPDWGVKHVVID